MNSKLIAAFFLGAVLLSGCSQENETEAALVSPSSETSAPVEPSIDACQVFAESQVQLTEAISEFAGNPSQDALNLLAASFDAQVEILGVLVNPADLDNAIELKDDAVRQFEKSRETDNVFEKGILLAGAALSAKEALELAQILLSDLNQQYKCN